MATRAALLSSAADTPRGRRRLRGKSRAPCAISRVWNYFRPPLIDDMHKAFDAVCAKLRLAPTADKATELVARKVVELAKAGRRGDDLTDETLRFLDWKRPTRPEYLGS